MFLKILKIRRSINAIFGKTRDDFVDSLKWGGEVECKTCGQNEWKLRYAGYITTGQCQNCGNIQCIHDG